MATAVTPTPFLPGNRTIDGGTLNAVLAQNLVASQTGITAHAGGGQINAIQITAILNRVVTAANANDSVKLPASTAGLRITIENGSANSIQVFGFGTDQINDIASVTGVAQPAGAFVTYNCTKKGFWHASAASDSIFSSIVLNGSTSGTATISANATNGTTTFTTPPTSGQLAISAPTPQAIAASATAGASNSGEPILLNAASGSTVTLPAATGSGNKYKFIVSTTVTSNAHKILAASSSDFLVGIAMGFTGSTAKVFASPGATNHSIQMPFAGTQPSGGFIGDYFNFTDISANVWHVDSMYQAGVTPTTPFSSATT